MNHNERSPCMSMNSFAGLKRALLHIAFSMRKDDTSSAFALHLIPYSGPRHAAPQVLCGGPTTSWIPGIERPYTYHSWQPPPTSISALEHQQQEQHEQQQLNHKASESNHGPCLASLKSPVVQELSLSLRILLKEAGQGDGIPLPTLLALQEFPEPVFKPLPSALPPLAGPMSREVDAEEEAPAALEESGDSADEVDDVVKAPANSSEPHAASLRIAIQPWLINKKSRSFICQSVPAEEHHVTNYLPS